MRDHLQHARGGADHAAPKSDAAPGRSTRSEDLDHATPMFAGAPQWEDVEAENADEREDIVAQPRPMAREADVGDGGDHDVDAGAARSSSPGADAVEVGGDEHDDPATAHAAAAPAPAAPAHSHPGAALPHNAHAKPYERNVKHAGVHHAKEDRFNKHAVKSNRLGNKHQVARPGVRVHGNDLFTVKHASAPRFTFVKEGGVRKVTPFDTVERSKISLINWKFGKHKQPAGKTRLLLNPSKPVRLHIEGKDVMCVMTWYGAGGAAWLRVSDIKGNTARILAAVRSHAKKWQPDAAAASIPTTHYKFRGDAVGKADDRDLGPKDRKGHHTKPLVLGPGQKGGDNVSHYLAHDFTNTITVTGADGTKHKEQVHRTTINICMTPPQTDAPPVACDIGNVGDAFFVPDAHGGTNFRRETSVFKNGAHKSKRRQTWVYGFLGKVVNGVMVPDRERRGWVPLRTLENA